MLRTCHSNKVLSEQVTELKSYISAVAEAELDGDDSVLPITAAHTAAYAVQLIKQYADPASLPCKVGTHSDSSSRTRRLLIMYSSSPLP